MVGCRAFLQESSPTQGSNPLLSCLLHWQAGSLPRVIHGKPHPCYAIAQDSSQSGCVMELLSNEQLLAAWGFCSEGYWAHSLLLSSSNASTMQDLWLFAVCLHSHSAFIVNISLMFMILLPGCSVFSRFGEFEKPCCHRHCHFPRI